MKVALGIKGIGSISALGHERAAIVQESASTSHAMQKHGEWCSKIPECSEAYLDEVCSSKRIKPLDRVVKFSIAAGKQALEQSGFDPAETGLLIGTSRGAQETQEHLFADFDSGKRLNPNGSPRTTLGNIASETAAALGIKGYSHAMSQTCSSGFQAILQAASWIEAGWAKRFIVIGAEAPLTPYFTQQMAAMKIYSNRTEGYPNLSLDLQKKENTFILGEGAVAIAIEKKEEASNYLASVSGLGFGRETGSHAASINANGKALQDAMKMALQEHTSIDGIVAHSPGTIQGDLAENKAIQIITNKVLNNSDSTIPVTGNKWKIGHTLGASGMFSLELGITMFARKEWIPVPYLNAPTPVPPKKLLINAQGFGGNAVSLVLDKEQ